MKARAQFCNTIQLAEINNMPRQKTYLYVQCQTVVHHITSATEQRVLTEWGQHSPEV